MFLIRKGEEPRPICRECRLLHATDGCPRTRQDSPDAVRIQNIFAAWVTEQEHRRRDRQGFVQQIASAKQLVAEGAR